MDGKRERRKVDGVCEVEIKQVAFYPPHQPDSPAQMQNEAFCLHEISWNPAFQPATGPDRELNPGFTQPSPENSQPYQQQTKDKAGVTRSGLCLFELLQGRDFSKQQLSKDNDKHLDEVLTFIWA